MINETKIGADINSEQPNHSEDHTANDFRKENLDKLIKHHVYAAMGFGLVPLPIVDFVGITAVQLNLLKKIANEYGEPFSKNTVKSIISSLIGSASSITFTGYLASSVAKVIPGAGTLTGTITMPAISGANTYAIGKVFIKHFESGGTFLTFAPEKMKEYYNQMFKEGKEAVEKAKTEPLEK